MTMTLDKRSTASGAYGETGSFEWAETLLATNGRLSAEDLALVLETNQGKALTPTLNGYLIKLLRRAREPGRKPKNAAVLDFTFADADERYQELLLQFREEDKEEKAQAKAAREKLPKTDEPASERAYKLVCEEMRKDLGVIHWTVLRNHLSLWRNSRHPNVHARPFEPPED
jgi:hypothetical protein